MALFYGHDLYKKIQDQMKWCGVLLPIKIKII
jgi:hypothetical protein